MACGKRQKDCLFHRAVAHEKKVLAITVNKISSSTRERLISY